MGVVYLGKDPTIQRFVAIKTMRLDKIDADDKLQEIKTWFSGKPSRPAACLIRISSRFMMPAKRTIWCTSQWNCCRAQRSRSGHTHTI